MLKPKLQTRSVRITTSGYASGATATVAIASLPANARLLRSSIECESIMTFSAGTTTGAAAVLGVSGTTNGFLATAALGSLTAGQQTDLGGPGTLVNRLRATTDVILTITPSGGAADSDEISGGVYWVHLEYEVAPERVR